MRTHYAIYVCPEQDCPKIAYKSDVSCPTHSKVMVRIIVRVEDEKLKEAERIRVAAEKMRKAGDNLKGGDPLAGLGGMQDLLRDLFKGGPSR